MTAMDPLDAGGMVGDLMTRDPIVVGADTPLSDVVDLLDRYDVSGVPVVDADGDLVGVISRTDLAQAQTMGPTGTTWRALTAGDRMTGPAVTVSEATSIADAVRLMQAEHVHRLVVVGEDGRIPLGLISTTDIVHAMAGRRA
jgi:CBS domain-containing protein